MYLGLHTMLLFCRNFMHECPFLTFQANLFHIIKVTQTSCSRRLTLTCPNCGISPSQPQTLVHFPPVKATTSDDVEHVFDSVSAIAEVCHDICVSARSTSVLLRHDPSVQLENGENKRCSVWITSRPEDTVGGMWRRLRLPAEVCVRVGCGGGGVIQQLYMSWLPEIGP